MRARAADREAAPSRMATASERGRESLARARRAAILARALVALFACALGACDSCSGEASVAELVSTRGAVQRDHAASVASWSAAEVGARFAIGDGVRTRTSARAELALGRSGARLRLEEDTTVRFLRHPGTGAALEVATGEAVLEAGDEELALNTRLGDAVLDARSRVRLRASGDGMDLSVLFGRAVLEDRTLEAGGELSVRFGEAALDPAPEEAAPVPEAAAPPPDVPGEAPLEPVEEEAPGEATVVRSAGSGSQLRTPGGAWRPIGDEPTAAPAGTRIRVPLRASVVLERGGARSVLEGRGEYEISTEGASLVRALSGRLEVTAGARDVAIEVPGGTIVVRGGDGGSQATMDVRGRRGTELSVVRGRGTVDGAQASDTLLAGETGVLTPEGALTVGGRGPERADFSIAAGATVTVHDPRPPTALGVRFGELCAGRAVVEVLRGRSVAASSAGEQRANVLLAAGAHPYRVRCLSGESAEPVASGSVRVLRDDGVQPLPPSAPRTVVDADGRTYRVMYQTHLPDITVRWPRAPASGPYVLTVTPSSGAPRTFSSGTPRVELPSGTISTGTYRLVFAAGAVSARPTTVEIRFDNAMPTASIRAPADRSFAPGDSVRVAGIAVPGWSASAGGAALALDSQLRFEGTVTAPQNEGAIAIELRHPSRGRHVYLRRSRASVAP